MPQTFPFKLYSVNYDYDAPIPSIKSIENEDMLAQEIEDCELYGYDIVSKEEFYEIFKAKFKS